MNAELLIDERFQQLYEKLNQKRQPKFKEMASELGQNRGTRARRTKPHRLTIQNQTTAISCGFYYFLEFQGVIKIRKLREKLLALSFCDIFKEFSVVLMPMINENIQRHLKTG